MEITISVFFVTNLLSSFHREFGADCKSLYIEDVLRENRLRLFGHRYRQNESLWTKKMLTLQIDGPAPGERPKLR